jgi:predicted TPR repeat methyltransferase
MRSIESRRTAGIEDIMAMTSTTDTIPENIEEPVSELSLEEALQVAVQLHRMHELDSAERLYRRILAAAPAHGDAMHFLGVLMHHRGRDAEAVELIRRAIALDRSIPDRHNNLGNILLQMDRHEEAADAYRRALALDANHAQAWNNLGALLRAQGRSAAARHAYQTAIRLDPGLVDAHNNLGNLYAGRGEIRQAIACYCRALTLMPGHPETRKMLGIAHYTLGETEKAAEVFRAWLAQEPDNPVARHLFAACSGREVPPRASDAYIESTFDGFAASFDARLGKLGYRAPELVAAALGRARMPGGPPLDMLDAGCGTGLCGPLLAPHAASLTGVDLSAGMLRHARARHVYGALVKAELQAYLAAQTARFDAIVSADTLVYFGPLGEVFAAACGALRPDGLLVFTVEKAEKTEAGEEGYRLNPHGRYSHAADYLEQALRAAGFAVTAMDEAVLRTEGGEPVAGLVVTARKTLFAEEGA